MSRSSAGDAWLAPSAQQAAPPDGSSVGDAVRWYRQVEGLTQLEAARLLNTSQSRLSKIENGSHHVRDVGDLRFIAGRLGIPPERLGVLPDQAVDVPSSPNSLSLTPGPVRNSQRNWLKVRRVLTENRVLLTELASRLYGGMSPILGTPMLTCDRWSPSRPVSLDSVELQWLSDAPPPVLLGDSVLTEHVRPLTQNGVHYSRYSRALRDLARPKLLDNRICYRLLDAEWQDDRGRLDFGYVSFFDAMDVSEAVAHEFASAWMIDGATPTLDTLPLRAAVTDPFDVAARPVFTGVHTLTIRRGARGDHRFYLHNRDAGAVASAGGVYHVIPAGAFQPSSMAPARQASDFSLWRTIQREFSEEFLGNPEHDGQESEPIDYAGTEPFRTMGRLRDQGRFNVHALGTALEPLTLWAEQLTVAVLDADAFDELFAEMVAVNDEGEILTTRPGDPQAGIPFTAAAHSRLATEPLSAISRACIELAWQSRRTLLA